MNNPYPDKLVDEASGIEVSNPQHKAWDEGCKAGQEEEYKKWVKAFMGAGILIAQATDVKIAIDETKRAGRREVAEWISSNWRRDITIEEWQAKLKEWELKI